MSDLAAALLAALDDQALDELAARLAPRLRHRLDVGADEDRWLESREAADYIGRSIDALHRLTAARRIPFRQDTPGAKCYFRTSELDRWLEQQRAAA